MDDKNKDLLPEDEAKNETVDTNLQEENTASNETETENAEKTEWEFDAHAPTIESDVIDTGDFEIELPNEEEIVTKKKHEPAKTLGENQIAVNTMPLKIAFTTIMIVALVACLAFLGVRYYTVPNGKEGDLMNPGGTALTVDGTDVSIGMYNYYYSCIVNQYVTYAGYGYYNDLDTSEDYSTQYTTDDDGNKITWLQKFEDDTIGQIQYITKYYNEALANGVKLTSEQNKTIKTQIESLESSASEATLSVDEYISANYGDYCSEETLKTMLEQCYIAENYFQEKNIDSKASDDEYDTYFSTHKNDYMSCDFAFIEMTCDTSTTDTIAADEAKAKEYIKDVKSVDDLKALIPTACSDLIDQYITNGYFDDKAAAIAGLEEYVENTMDATDTSYGEETADWLFNSDNKVGSTTTYTDTDNGYIYMFLKTGEPSLDEEQVYSVRHILVTPGSDDEDSTSTDTQTDKEYTDEEWAAAKTEADKILKEWQDGDKTEYSFALLAESDSDDTESTSAGSSGLYGGLYDGVTKGQMVEDFEGWALDSSRKYGDTGIVKSDYGYHIMYFVGSYPQYEFACRADIKSNKEDDFVDSAKVEKHKKALAKTTKATPQTDSSTSSSAD